MKTKFNFKIFLYVYFCLTAIFCFPKNVFSQSTTPSLERNISINLSNEKPEAALNKIAKQGGFTFSYNPSIIDNSKSITLNVTKKTVREVLNMMFRGKIDFKVKGNYIILQKAKEETVTPAPKDETILISGYILNEEGEKLPWASIYDKQTLASAVSDKYGFYVIELLKKPITAFINISKKSYNDTIVEIQSDKNDFLHVVLKKEVVPISMDSLYAAAEENARSLFMSDADYANTSNIKDTLYRKYQASFLPFMGTNKKLSGNIINDYSFNLLGG